MPGEKAKELAQLLRDKSAEFLRACEGLDEKAASRAPEGRWSPKEIISHLCGPEGIGMISSLRAFVEKDTPLLDMKPEDPFCTPARSRMTMAELLAQFRKEYETCAEFALKLTDADLARKARIPMLKESPLGEYPTLEQWIEGIADYHISFHVEHMKEIRQALGA